MLACVLLAVAPSGVASAQSPSDASVVPNRNRLLGYVVDVLGKPMEGVEVYIAGTDRTTRTDARGYWRIENPPVGPHVVVARQLGYAPAVREIVIESAATDTIPLPLRRYPQKLSAVEIQAETNAAYTNANITAERLMQLRVGSGRLYTRDQILRLQPYSVAELVMGVPGLIVKRGRGEIVATITRSGVGSMSVKDQPCQLQFYLDGVAIDNEVVASLNPFEFRSVEVYPQSVMLTGLPMRRDKCGAIVINSFRK